MKILALDTSSKAGSCALLDDNTLRAEYYIDTNITHSETILKLTQDMMEALRLPMDALDLLAVSEGPGSFTGLRIGISAMKGMAMGLEVPVVGVSTLQGLAYNFLGIPGLIIPALDARRNTLYTALFSSDGNSIRRLTEDLNIPILKLAPLIDKYQQEHAFHGQVYVLGDGADLTIQLLQKEKPSLTLTKAPLRLLHQRAGSVALAAKEIAATKGTLTSAELAPVYLRMVQAERERLENEKNSKV